MNNENQNLSNPDDPEKISNSPQEEVSQKETPQIEQQIRNESKITNETIIENNTDPQPINNINQSTTTHQNENDNKEEVQASIDHQTNQNTSSKIINQHHSRQSPHNSNLSSHSNKSKDQNTNNLNNINNDSPSSQRKLNLNLNSSSTINSYSTLGLRIMTTKFQKKTDISKFTLNDLNNYVGSDRLLVINSTYEFWVHDVLLISTSNLFKKYFLTHEVLPLKEEQIISNDINPYIKTYINVPHSEYFFDILTWIYSRNSERLASSADDPESFLSILNLGIHLELCDEFFNSILNKCDVQLDENLIQYPMWSRLCFTFEVLINLIKLMPKDNYLLKTCSLLSWLKEDSSLKSGEEMGEINEREVELFTSNDFFLVKKYLKDNNYLTQLSIYDLKYIKEKYFLLLPALDIDFLIKKYLEESTIKIVCKVCKKKTNNIQDFINNPCEIKMYHPKNFAYLQRQLHPKCEHEDCSKKLTINEYPCCHKAAHIEGCMMSDGNHILEFS